MKIGPSELELHASKVLKLWMVRGMERWTLAYKIWHFWPALNMYHCVIILPRSAKANFSYMIANF